MASSLEEEDLEARSIDEDDSLADSDSGYWAAGESTRSVTSSIYDYEEAHGRTYHAYNQGKYKLPNDKDEQKRIEIKYHAIRLALSNTLFFAPIEAPSSILDVGTGTGLWAIDVADTQPQASVVGIDLSPIMTNLVPPNVEFQIHDADEPWDFTRKFDLIHCRIMNDFTLRSWPHYFEQAYENMLPGGWVECQEFDYHRQSDDDSIPENSRLAFWEEEWTRGIQKIGLQGACKPDLVMQQMRDAGFVNVEYKLFKMPIGPWPKDPRMRDCGLYGLVNLLDGLHGLSAKIFCDLLGYNTGQMERLLNDCRRELCRRDIHSYYPVYVILGQRPKEEMDTTS